VDPVTTLSKKPVELAESPLPLLLNLLTGFFNLFLFVFVTEFVVFFNLFDLLLTQLLNFFIDNGSFGTEIGDNKEVFILLRPGVTVLARGGRLEGRQLRRRWV
jgi:hypothetical protein